MAALHVAKTARFSVIDAGQVPAGAKAAPALEPAKMPSVAAPSTAAATAPAPSGASGLSAPPPATATAPAAAAASGPSSELAAIQAAVTRKQSEIKEQKKKGASPEALEPLNNELAALRTQLSELEKSIVEENPFDRKGRSSLA